MLRVRWLVAVGACAGLLAASGCGGGGAPDDAGSLVYALGTEPDTLNPLLREEHVDPVTQMVFRGLTAHNGANEVVPALAEDWTVSDDELTYTFDLREDVTWHDGEPFTAADVVFTLNGARGSDVAAASKFSNVERVSAPEAHTVVIELSAPAPALLDALATGILPEHLLKGKGIDDPGFARHPVGTGPFKLTEWKQGQFAELAAFDDYYEGAPGLDEIVIAYVPDAATRLIKLNNGEVDAAALEPQQAADFKDRDDVRLEVYPTADYRGLMFNMAKDLFADPAVRQAMNYAVDREAIVDSVLHGYGTPADGPMDTIAFLDEDAANYGFDPGRVEDLMAGAGYAKNGDGVWAKGGEPLAFEISTFAEDGVRVGIAEVLATQLREQGFDATSEPQPRDSVQWAELDAFVIGWGTPYDPDTSVYAPFHSSEVLAEGGSNLGSYVNEDVDAALDKARSTGDEDVRAAAYADFQRALVEDPPYVWVAYPDAVNAVPANLQGPEERTLGHHGYGFFWNVAEWSYAE